MATVAGLLAASGLAATVDAAPVAVSAANWNLMVNSLGFSAKLSDDCIDPSREDMRWAEFGAKAPFKYTRIFQGIVPVSGSFDPATRNGTISGSGYALRFDNYNAHARAIRVGAFGLRAGGGALTITGRIERTRTIFSRFGPPTPLLRVKRFTLDAGPFQRKGKDVADSLVIALQGRATVLPAFARELTRIRCRGSRLPRSRPIRAGASFGVVLAQLRPDAAVGVGGLVELEFARLEGDDGPIGVAPTGSARIAGKRLQFDLAADLRTPLTCASGYDCSPAIGAQLPLGDGGFTLSYGGHSVTVAGLRAESVDDGRGGVAPMLSGTIDGSPVAVIRGLSTTEDFDARVKAALGTQDLYIAPNLGAHFTKTVAP